MSAHGLDPDLTRPTQSGVYFVGDGDLDRLARTALRDELHVSRTDLAGCRDKDALLRRLAVSLQLPATFGQNWDALADCLRDPHRVPAWGHVLLFDHVDELRRAAEADYDTLLGILDDAATFGSEHETPWFAFLALPDDALDSSHAAS
ncbi:barstar family protein [Rhodanobacter sp. C01]|uniref:barstar family protein n=1 Tax=Rhodanobacter sp. C01 TaxID=1945856 RepID=UPI0009848AF2|nr:barstar family protein [Rhodanobacter sp. C01]OOG47049.1 barnase inhibitor [Rhodanobacter sp. C01]